MKRFEGKVALITGAASGIGRAACIRFATEGARVYAVDLNAEGLAETAKQIKATQGEIETGAFDISRREQCFAAVEGCVTTFGNLDVLANVAGIVRFSHSHKTSEEEWDKVLAINLSGPFFLSQAAIPHLLKSKGNIVNVASNAGLMGQAYTSAYCASKGGLVQLTRAMAMEYMKETIRINAVCPGGTDTALVSGINFPEDLDWDLIDRYTGKRGYGQAADVASAIAYLASEEACMVHGAIFTVDNGMMAG